MTWAIVADLHGDLNALEQIVGMSPGLGVDRFAFLGDFVKFGRDPEESLLVSLARSLPHVAVRGNHDEIALHVIRKDADTREALGPENVRYLRKLPKRRRLGRRVLLQHSPYRSMLDRMETIGEARQIFERISLRDLRVQVRFVGHVHTPFIYCCSASGQVTAEPLDQGPVALLPDARYIISPGLTGLAEVQNVPKTFMVYDDEDQRVELFGL